MLFLGKKREVKPGSLLTPSSAVKPRFVVNEVVEQVAYAERIIFNKIDLVSEAELEVLTKKIKHINGIAQIKLAKFGSVDMDFVLGVGGYDLERFDSEVQLDPYISLERCMCSSPDPYIFLSLAFKVKRK
ncbi:hypothetical protein ACB092_05G090300 [Castanea dentata]